MKKNVCYILTAFAIAIQMGCATKLSTKSMPEITRVSGKMSKQQAVKQLTRLNLYSGRFNKFYPDATALTKRISNGEGVEAANAIVTRTTIKLLANIMMIFPPYIGTTKQFLRS